MANKKVVFVIVEGPTDEDALSDIFNCIYDKNSVYVHVRRCDITTEKGVNPSNIISKIGNEIRIYAKRYGLKNGDFKEIIHIVDTDGAYIPNASVIEDLAVSDHVYAETGIRTNNKYAIEQRNIQKKSNINKLCSCNDIWKIPYRVFYMSCNLDHVLHNKLNSSDEEKEKDAFRFAKLYEGKTSEFLKFISCSDFSVMSGYKESWAYIKQDLHSLERHTNLGLCFNSEDDK